MNAETFTELYAQHKHRLISVVMRVTRNIDHAEDIAASAFVIAFEKRGTFRGESSFGTWVTAIALNKIRDEWRSSRASNTESIETGLSKEITEPDLLIQTLHRRECCTKLRQVLRRIDTRHRRVLTDHFLRGYPIKMIAKRYRLPSGTVLSRIFTAKRILRQAWGD